MKKFVYLAFASIFCICSSVIIMAEENSSTTVVESSDSAIYQPGSNGALIQNEEGNIMEISPDELLAYGHVDSTQQGTESLKVPENESSTRALKPLDPIPSYYKPIVLIHSRFDGAKKDTWGTGFVAGPYGIVTAGHCLYYAPEKEFASKIEIFVRNNAGTYEKKYTTSEFEAMKNSIMVGGEYAADGNSNDDWGIISFKNKTLSNYTGYYGYKSTNDFNNLKNHNSTVVGYFGDTYADYSDIYMVRAQGPFKTQIQFEKSLPAAGIAVEVGPHMSGSPIADNIDDSDIACAIIVKQLDNDGYPYNGALIINSWLNNAITENCR